MFQFQRHRKQRSLLRDPGSRESRPGVIQKQRSAGGLSGRAQGKGPAGPRPGRKVAQWCLGLRWAGSSVSRCHPEDTESNLDFLLGAAERFPVGSRALPWLGNCPLPPASVCPLPVAKPSLYNMRLGLVMPPCC